MKPIRRHLDLELMGVDDTSPASWVCKVAGPQGAELDLDLAPLAAEYAAGAHALLKYQRMSLTSIKGPVKASAGWFN